MTANPIYLAIDTPRLDRAQALDVFQLDVAWAQRDPVVRGARDDHRLRVAGEDEAGDAQLAGLGEHVGHQQIVVGTQGIK